MRFQRRDPTTRVIVYYKGERMGPARLLDPVANDRPASGAAHPLRQPPGGPGAEPGGAAGAAAKCPKHPPSSPVTAAQITPHAELSTPHSL